MEQLISDFFLALNLLYCMFLKFLMVTEEWNPAVKARSWIQPLWLKKPKLANIKLLSLTYYTLWASVQSVTNMHYYFAICSTMRERTFRCFFTKVHFHWKWTWFCAILPKVNTTMITFSVSTRARNISTSSIRLIHSLVH